MKNWFSQLFTQVTEQGRNAIRLALFFIAAAFLTTVVFAYLALQNGTWQPYVVATAFIVFLRQQVLVLPARSGTGLSWREFCLPTLWLTSRLNHY